MAAAEEPEYLDLNAYSTFICVIYITHMGKSKRPPHADHTKKKTTAKAKAKDTVPECAVCLDPMLKTDEVQTLPCRHRFHTACVQEILDTPGLADVCPLCRANIETGGQQPPLEAAGAGFAGMPPLHRQHARYIDEAPRGSGRGRRPLRRQNAMYLEGWRPTQNELDAGLGAGGYAAAGAAPLDRQTHSNPGFLGAAEATGPFGNPSGPPPRPNQFGPGGGGGGMTRDQREEDEARQLRELFEAEQARDAATSSTGTAPGAAAEGSTSGAGDAIAGLALGLGAYQLGTRGYPYAAAAANSAANSAAENCTICGGRRIRRGRVRTRRGKTKRGKTRRRKTRTGRTRRKHRRT